MPLRPASLRRFVRRALVDATGTASPDRAQLAAAFDVLSAKFRQRLQPIFGTVAVEALFVRAVHVATREFGWLHDVLPKRHDQGTIARVSSLDPLDPGAVEEGLAAVLAHNIDLLTAFVGEDLVLPLVQQAWDAVAVVDLPAPKDDQ
jgi:hypothetical protein